jgi:hypothetical protein
VSNSERSDCLNGRESAGIPAQNLQKVYENMPFTQFYQTETTKAYPGSGASGRAGLRTWVVACNRTRLR